MNNETQPVNRQFRWLSSITGDPALLSALNDHMAWFYSQQEGRQSYQTMLESIEESPHPVENSDLDSEWLPKYICNLQPNLVLEIGCSTGRVYRQLRKQGYANDYFGLEVADYVIQQNIQRHPEATWKCSSAYEIPFPDNYFDLCFSTYVLEHLVYPERALKEMLRVIRQSGCLILVFPDFVASGRFASQQLGFSPIARAAEKLRSGRILDVLVSLYDSRVRLPRALKLARQDVGQFPVNLAPICLSYPDVMGADVDAIYVASKQEIHDWAVSQGYSVEYPSGIEGYFAEHTFMTIQK
jgi:SAM-dependent methyltransferase